MTGYDAFLYHGGEMIDLNTVAGPGLGGFTAGHVHSSTTPARLSPEVTS